MIPLQGRVIRTAPATAGNLPVSLERARQHLGVTHDDDDARIRELILAAQDALQPPTGWLVKSVMKQTLRLDLSAWPSGKVHLPHGPVIEGGESNALAVTYFDTEANESQEVGDEFYFLDGDELLFTGDFTAPALYTRPFPVRITYDAGYENAAALPSAIGLALLIMVRDYYDGVPAGTVTQAARELVEPLRNFALA